MNPLLQVLRHLIAEDWQLRRDFPRRVLERIQGAVNEQEKLHDSELRFAVEGGLPIMNLLRGQTARARAIEEFGALQVWNT